MKILIIEDDPIQLKILAEIVQQNGYETTGCRTAESGLSYYHATIYGIILTDLFLPGMDGWEFCRKIRHQPGGHETLILAITGANEPEEIQSILLAGADDYMTKPVSREQLTIRLAVLEQRYQSRKQRRLAEEALTNALDQTRELERIINQSPVVLFLWRYQDDWPVEFVSENVSQFGYQPRDFVEQRILFTHLIYPEDLPRIQERIREAAQMGCNECEDEFRLVTHRGEIHWVEIRIYFRHNDLGQITHVQCLALDISSRKKIEMELQMKNSAIESAINAIAFSDLRGNLIYVNTSFLKMWGYSHEDEVVNQPAVSFWADPKEALQIMKHMQTGDNWIGEMTGRRKNGTLIQVQLSGTMVKDELGHPVCMMGSFVDISHRKHVEEQNRRLSFAVEQSPSPIVITDVQGRIEYVNPRFGSLTGYHIHEVLGENPRILKSGETPPEEYNRLWETITRGGEWHGEFHNRKKNGELYWEVASISPMRDVNGQITHFLKVAEDVTARKEAEQQIHNQFHFLRILLDTIPSPIFYKDIDGVYLGCNKAFENFLGLPADKIIGQTVFDISPKKNAEIYHQKDQELLDHPGTQVYESTVQYADGTYHDVIFNKATYHLPDKSIGGLVGVIIDITERKQMEAALQQRTTELNERVKEVTCLYSLSRLLEDTALSVDQILQKTVELIPSGWIYPDLTGVRLTFADKVFQSQNYGPHRYKQISHIYILGELVGTIEIAYLGDSGEDTKNPFLEEEQELLNEITDRLGRMLELRLAEGALRASEAKHRALLEVIPDLIFKISKKGIYLDYHANNPQELVLPPDQIIGKRLHDVLPDIADEAMKHIEKAIQTGRIQVFEYYTHHKNTRTDYEARIVASGESEVLTIVRNITNRKIAERKLSEERELLAQKVAERTRELSAINAHMERANRLKDEFFANMSHELRTPLNTVLGLTEALQDEAFGSLTAEQVKALRSIDESGRHLLSLINDMLDLSKIGAGKFELEIHNVNIKLICETSLRFIRQEALKKDIQISLILKQEIDTIQADERRLKQILVNLLSNAIKFTPAKGAVGLEVDSDPEQQVIHFTVWDTGIGIPEEDFQHLFKPFTQLDSALTRRQPGTGLGLSIVEKMALLHGGGVSVESKAGEGSRFKVSLPRHQGEAVIEQLLKNEAKTAPAHQSVVNNGKKNPLILVVDDNELVLETLCSYLEVKKYRYAVARTGKEALHRAIEDKPDLILMDILMPEMNGLQAIAELKSRPYTRHIPIIAITALAMTGDRERCLEAGADEYMSKPLMLRKLLTKINELLE